MTLYIGPHHDIRRAKDKVIGARAELRTFLSYSGLTSDQRAWAREVIEETQKLSDALERIEGSLEVRDVG